MDLLDKLKEVIGHDGQSDKRLYRTLTISSQLSNAYEKNELGEQMSVVSMLIGGYWKPRILLNHTAKCAYEFMDAAECLQNVRDEDIDWESIKELDDDCIYRVRHRNAHFPSFIRTFSNGVAEVQWQLNPDGYYWMDEDGFGMTSDSEVNIYGFIDTSCKVVVPYQAVKSVDDLRTLRSNAEEIVRRNYN